MKILPKLILLTLVVITNYNLHAQKLELDSVADPSSKEIVLTKNDGTEYIGVILEQDDREVLLLTKTIGKVYVPKHEIQSIEEIKEEDFREGVYLGNNLFSTRYFLTTNGLPMKKGDSYALIQLFGPEFQIALNEHFTVGVITTWLGMPLIGSVKYSVSAGENVHFAVGSLVGTGTWLSLGSVGAIGYGSLTFGNHMKNLSFTAGYAGFSLEGDTSSSLLLSIAGMAKINQNIAFVGDSFIYPGESAWALIIPGLRFRQKNKGEFQFGLGAVLAGGEIVPAPIPMISWFRKI